MSFFHRPKGNLTSKNRPASPMPTTSTSADHPRSTFNRTDNLHNFGVVLELLKNVGEGSELFGPLKAICGGLKVLVDIAEAVQQNDEDIQELHRKLGRQLGHLNQQSNILADTKSKIASGDVEILLEALKVYILDLDKIQEILNTLKNEDNGSNKRVFKKVLKFHSIREDIKGCSRRLDESFQLCMQSIIGFIAHQTILMRNDLANDAISRLPCADARGSQHEPCLEGTRVDILEEIRKWAMEGTAKPVLALIDQAGTGKSTISVHMGQKWENDDIPTARFFFSLPKSITTATDVATTLARDLAKGSPLLRTLILDAINTNPNIVGYSIQEKLEWFVLTPLRRLRDSYSKVLGTLREDMKQHSYSNAPVEFYPNLTRNAITMELERLYTVALEKARSDLGNNPYQDALKNAYMSYMKELEKVYIEVLARPPVIIVDALDECIPQDRRIFLDSVFRSLATEPIETPILRVFLTSRPESDIISQIHDNRHDHLVHQISFGTIKMNPSNTADIALYAAKYLSHILTPSQLTLFIARASGVFIWASTAKEFIEKALDPSIRFESLISQNVTNSPLDSLYYTILHSAIESIGSDQVGLLQKVLQVICTAREPLNTTAIDELVALRKGLASEVVRRLRSILSDGPTIQVLHPTFIEYFQAGRQSHDLQFVERNAEILLARGCLNVLCSENLDVKDLQSRINENTTPGLRYAAVHGISHVISSREDNATLTRLREFFESNLIYWIELTSLLGEVSGLLQSVYHLKSELEGLDTHSTDDLMMDNKQWCEDIVNMTQPFQAAIEESAMQVYFSALSFAPPESKLVQLYHQKFMDKTPKILRSSANTKSIALARHDYTIHRFVFSPDGRRVASAHQDRTIQLWNAATGAAVGQPLTGHTDKIACISFSSDGQVLTSASYDGTTRHCDTATGAVVVGSLAGPTAWIECISFSHDGRVLASGYKDGIVRLWDVLTRAAIGQPQGGRTSKVVSLSFSPDNQILASRSLNGTVRLWDTVRGAAAGEPLTNHYSEVVCLSFSPNAQILALGYHDGAIRLWDVATGAAIGKPLASHVREVTCISFSLDGRILASGCRGGIIRLWDAATGVTVGEPLTGHIYWILCLSFSPDGQIIASGCVNGMVRLWDAATGAAIGKPLKGHAHGVVYISFSHDSRILASRSGDGMVRLWDVTIGAADGDSTVGHHGRIMALSFSPAAQILASGSGDGTVRLWDTATGAVIGKPLLGHDGEVMCISFSPDGRMLASGSGYGTVRVWNASIGAAVGEPLTSHYSEVVCLSFSPDAQTLASGYSDGKIRLWDTETGVVIGESSVGPGRYLSLSLDTRILASGIINRTICLWNAVTGAAIGAPFHHTSKVQALSFNDPSSSLPLVINQSEAAWNLSTMLSIGVASIQESTDQLQFQYPWTLIKSSSRIKFTIPSSIRCTKFSAYKGYLAYGGEDGSVIIGDYKHLI